MRTAKIRGFVAFAVIICTCVNGVSAQMADAAGAKTADELAKRLGVVTLSKGTSSWREKKRSLAQIPLHALNPKQRARADQVLRSVSQFRRLPTIQAAVEPEVYQYFLNHPDTAVSLWRVMQISDFKMWQTGPFNFEADAGDGSQGIADYIYRDNRQALVVCEGLYQNSVLKNPIKARALVHLQYQFQQVRPGQPPVVTQHIAAYVSFPQTAVKTVAKVISPVTNRIMDRNCLEITVFLKVMSDSMQTRPQWVRGMAKKMDGVLDVRRTELAELANRVNTAAKARSGQTYTQQNRSNDPRQNLMPITGPSGSVIRRASQSRTVPPIRR